MKAIIIGAGPSGLFTAAILAKEGYEVTVIEKNQIIGGGLQSFKRFGETFDIGMHAIGGLEKGGNVRAICNWLGITDKINFREIPSDHIYIQEDGNTYEIVRGRMNFTDRIISYFPEQSAGIKEYIKEIYRIAGEINVFNLKESNSLFLNFGKDYLLPANKLIEKYISDRRLQSILAWMNTFYSGVKDVTPAYIHAILQVLYIEGSQGFVGGSIKFAELLEDFIKAHGGHIVKGHPVKKIETQNSQVLSITIDNGEKYSADCYVSSIDPTFLITTLDKPNVLPRTYRERIESSPVSYSAFSVFLKLKPQTIPCINYSGYIYKSYNTFWQFSDENEDSSYPQGLVYSTQPENKDDKWARKMVITSPILWSSVQKWESTQIGNRGAEYKKWKEDYCNKILDIMEDVIPDIRNCIEAINTASPLTIRDYYNTKHGNLSGFVRDCNHIEQTILPVNTKLQNLYLTGQNNNIHGFCGVALTAMLTCEAVLNCNNLIERISKCKD